MPPAFQSLYHHRRTRWAARKALVQHWIAMQAMKSGNVAQYCLNGVCQLVSLLYQEGWWHQLTTGYKQLESQQMLQPTCHANIGIKACCELAHVDFGETVSLQY